MLWAQWLLLVLNVVGLLAYLFSFVFSTDPRRKPAHLRRAMQTASGLLLMWAAGAFDHILPWPHV